MKKILIPCALIGAVILSAAAAKKSNDPVLMTVNGKDVRLSEFEYLYNKNNRQQAEPQSLDEYLDMFVTYKLKVADAEAAGIDTTAAFAKEFQGYCTDAAKPFLRDSTVELRLAGEAYKRMGTLRDVSHIMLPLGRNAQEREANRARLDSIRTAILGGASFEEMAVEFSSDPSAKRNKGNMGYITANAFPYPFELAAYETPVGGVSEVVEDAPYGFHIVRVNGEMANPGQVRASHILKMTRGLSGADSLAKKQQIDSIYQVLLAGADFAEVAGRESEDSGSGKKGGDLGFFGKGRMVKEFDQTAFSLADGQMSAPFKTDFGYHIVKVTGHKPLGTLEEEKPMIMRAMSNDVRSTMPEKERAQQLRRQYKGELVPAGVAAVQAVLTSQIVSTNPAPDTDNFAAARADKTVVARVGKTPVTAAEVLEIVKPGTKGDPSEVFAIATERVLDQKVREAALADLANTDADYRNLVNEYRDGILLFEISNRNVWGKSTADTLGLKQYFEANRDKYAWTDGKPRFKGCIVFATNDSISNAARQFLAQERPTGGEVVDKLRAKFGRNVKVERVVAAQGENAIVDNAAFGGELPEAPGSWKVWFPYDYRIISQPEEAGDLRGAVSNDYQSQLEAQWVAELHKKYPYKLNDKEVKKLKK